MFQYQVGNDLLYANPPRWEMNAAHVTLLEDTIEMHVCDWNAILWF